MALIRRRQALPQPQPALLRRWIRLNHGGQEALGLGEVTGARGRDPGLKPLIHRWHGCNLGVYFTSRSPAEVPESEAQLWGDGKGRCSSTIRVSGARPRRRGWE